MSLIDHILTNSVTQEINSGVIITDISDHFPVFIELPSMHTKCKIKVNPLHNFSRVNLEKFRDNLSHLDWANVIDQSEVDLAYGNFWDTFKTLFDLNFPIGRTKFNKNYHKINGYMTKGLLVSRSTKLKLLKNSANNPSPENLNAYRNFRNIYTKTLRASKKLYFNANFEKAQKNPKKTWELIRKAIGSDPKKSKISKITVQGLSIEDPNVIPDEFNKFFAKAARNVVNSIGETNIKPESFLKNNNAPTLEFSSTSPGEIVDIIRGFQP